MASKKQPICEECDEGKEEPAEFVCNDCGAYLCSDWVDDHGCYESRTDEIFNKSV